MGDRIHALAQQLTGKASLDDCSLDELTHIANRFPYFAPAQFLLLQKLRQAGHSEEASAHYQKAVLYYPDPLQFDRFIASDNFLMENETSVSINQSDAVCTTEQETSRHQDEAYEGEPENTHEAGTLQTEILAEQDQHAIVPDVEDAKRNDDVGTEESRLQLAEVDEPLSDAANSNDAEAEWAELPASDTEKAEPSFHRSGAAEIESAGTESPLSTEQATPIEEKPKPEPSLVFEPYHTVDYFASQGIKMSQEELPKDKLGQGLKSFTEWLKTMKRLPATQLTAAVESPAEKKVETLADRSLSESDVVTEAMAEVWAKQGNREKALDIYNKLVLHNPSKKAYFAAKIDHLKQS